ncbi:unnamed protein product [Brachionus calyciflorus]|uniref:SF3 helicase domain-containing protein n=1 Tax=Brachionus calyciflorus TaxID=104777 RepID=A0A814LKN0_9BILA|nr:unnamed protein product [Brachionus calyciflorus]
MQSENSEESETSTNQQNNNLRSNTIKRSRLFAVTVSYINVSKAVVFDLLEEFCCRLLVAEEPHFNNEPHHHIYMRTLEKLKIKEIRSIINTVYQRPQIEEEDGESNYAVNGVLVQTVRNEVNYLKYITKFDVKPIFMGILESNLSFYYNTIRWATTNVDFQYTDPHVLNYPQYYKLLEKVHVNVQNKNKHEKVEKLRPFLNVQSEEVQNSWQNEVIIWWNDWIVNGFKHKKHQLFLWGPSNTGKTTFIHSLIKTCVNPPSEQEDQDENFYEEQIFRPTPNEKRFAWQEFDSSLHNITLIDEFDITEYNVTDLKKILSGECLIANRKGQTSQKIQLRMPMIFISNLPPPVNDMSTQMQGFRERIKIVKADKLIK